jgi:uncharacterized protein YlzI (FlbEa/FlbD family)
MFLELTLLDGKSVWVNPNMIVSYAPGEENQENKPAAGAEPAEEGSEGSVEPGEEVPTTTVVDTLKATFVVKESPDEVQKIIKRGK